MVLTVKVQEFLQMGVSAIYMLGKWNMDKKHLFLTTFKIHTFIRYKHFNGTRMQDSIVNLGFKCAHLFKKSKCVFLITSLPRDTFYILKHRHFPAGATKKATKITSSTLTFSLETPSKQFL